MLYSHYRAPGFFHRESEAAGVCKRRGGGVCQSCVRDVGNALPCPGHCDGEVQARSRVIARNTTAYEKTSGARVLTAVICATVAA